MKRALLLLFVTCVLTSCSDKNRAHTNYTFIIDHYSGEIEEMILNALSIQDYSPCPNLSTPTYRTKIIRYDLTRKNETRVIRKSLLQSIFPSRLSPNGYSKKLAKFAFPANLRRDQGENIDAKNLEYYLNSLSSADTRVYGLNSLGLQYKNLEISHNINHFQNIYDLKDALSDYICNKIDSKNIVILLSLFRDTGLEDCLAQCELLPENPICADDGKKYRNAECLKCYGNLKEIPCNQRIPVFSKEALTERAFEIFYQFAEAQELIANDKNAPIADDLIENTLRLFDGNDKRIEILNLGTTSPIRFSTTQYLERLRTRPFDEIAIDWDRDWTVVQDWSDAGTEIPESQMSAEGQQYFRGFRKNLVAYSDAIKKKVNFQAKLVESIDTKGNEVLEWKVLIGDISIASQPTEL